jgi:ethanolamine utilization cobalamin adenosyltransferase
MPAPVRSRLDDDIRGRKFLSEYDIRKQLTANSQELRIPKDSIISPLAEDWLALRRIKIIRE